MVREIRDAHHEELKDASRQDRIAFYNSKVRSQEPVKDRAQKSAV